MPELNISEGFSLGESIQKVGPIILQITEGFSLGESIEEIGPIILQITEGFSLGESIEKIGPIILQITEGFSLGESIEKIGPINLVITEGFSLGESIEKIGPINLVITEGFSLGESIEKIADSIPEEHESGIFSLFVGHANPQTFWSRSYEPWPLQRDAIRISLTEQIDSLQLTLSNIGWIRQLKILRSDDVHGKIVRIWQGFLDIDKEEANLSPLFEGEIDRVSFDERVMTIALKGNVKYLEKDGLRRTFSIFCPFQFKGRQCGYVGPDSICDKSYTDCNSKGNSKNFGGFNTLLKIQGTREII